MSRYPQELSIEQEELIFERILPALNDAGDNTDLLLFAVLARRLIVQGHDLKDLRTLLTQTAKLRAATAAH
jgi:hypothetical protein